MKIPFAVFLALLFFVSTVTFSAQAVQRFIPQKSREARVTKIDRSTRCGTWKDRYRKNARVKCEKEARDKARRTRAYKSEILKSKRPRPTYIVRYRKTTPNLESSRKRRVSSKRQYYLHYGLTKRASKLRNTHQTNPHPFQSRGRTVKRYYRYYQQTK